MAEHEALPDLRFLPNEIKARHAAWLQPELPSITGEAGSRNPAFGNASPPSIALVLVGQRCAYMSYTFEVRILLQGRPLHCFPCNLTESPMTSQRAGYRLDEVVVGKSTGGQEPLSQRLPSHSMRSGSAPTPRLGASRAHGVSSCAIEQPVRSGRIGARR